MRILVNTSCLTRGGGLQVALSFIEECRAHPEHDYHIVLEQSIHTSFDTKSFPENHTFYAIKKPSRHPKSILQLKALEKTLAPDCVFSVFGPAYWTPKAPHLVGFALPPFYDDSPYKNLLSRLELFKHQSLRRFKYQRFAKEADALVAETDYIRSLLLKLFPHIPTYTVSNTFHRCFSLAKPVATINQETPPIYKLLYVSAYYRHKNFEIIPEVVDALLHRGVKDFCFYLTLPEAVYAQIIPEKYRYHVLTVGPQHIENCPSLYQQCHCSFIPTLTECFTATYPESMVMRRPILTSDLSFARSLCGEAALYFQPLNPEDIAEKIILLMHNKELQNSLILKGEAQVKLFHSAADRATAYLDICKNLIIS